MKTNPRVQATLKRLRGTFDGFTSGQRTITIIAVLVALVGGVVFMTWLQKPTMAPLYTGLSSTDASAITAKLSAAGEPYEIADSGSTILIPAADVNQRRLDMAGAGLPTGSGDGADGYKLLDQSGFGTSDRQQQMNEKRATEGELQKTIESIAEVQGAKVLLAVPQQDVFTSEKTPATASVVVTMRPSATLDSGKVDAIVHLVASAVPNLDPKNVTVTDATGKLLNAPGAGGSSTGQNDARMAQANAKSAQLTSAIQAMLDKAVGPGNSSVNVNAELSFDDTKTTTNQYIQPPANGKPLHQSTATEGYNGAGNVPQGGVLGPDSTLVPSSSGSANSKYTNSKADTQYAVGTQTTETQVAAGGVKRLTVAVMLNSSTAGAANIGEITKLVSAAAGVDAKRNDVVTVTKVAFDTKAAAAATAAADAAAAAERQDQLIGLAKNVGLGLLVLIALIIGYRRSRRGDDEEDLGALPSAYGNLPSLPAAPPAPTPLEYQLDDELPALSAAPTDPQAEVRAAARAEISALVEDDSDEVARLLRGWITERN